MVHPKAAKVRGWGCSQCKGEDYQDQDWLREERNCDGKGNLFLDYDPSIKRCPWSQMSQEVRIWLSVWQEFSVYRILPYGGTDIMTYPAYYLEAVEHCEGVKNQIQTDYQLEQQRHHEKQRVQSKRGGR